MGSSDHDRLSDSLAEFMDDHPYGVEMLCHDLALFRHLLGDGIKGDFLHVAAPLPPAVDITGCHRPAGTTSLAPMETLERLVVHVEEAVRHATMNDDPHLRLGLLLLDSAAELLLHRECQSTPPLGRERRATAAPGGGAGGGDGQRAGMGRGAVGEGPTPAQCKKIDRDFGVKCDYLESLGMLAGPHARVLKKLHKYRNEAYHRDQLRLGTLASATKIYAYLVCSLMRDFPMHGTRGFIHLPPRPPAGLLKYLQEGDNWLSLVLSKDGSAGLQARIASRLLADAGICLPFGVGEVLSQHFCGRLVAAQEAAGEAASSFF